MKRRTLIQILGASALTGTLGMLTQPAAAQSTAGLISFLFLRAEALMCLPAPLLTPLDENLD